MNLVLKCLTRDGQVVLGASKEEWTADFFESLESNPPDDEGDYLLVAVGKEVIIIYGGSSYNKRVRYEYHGKSIVTAVGMQHFHEKCREHQAIPFYIDMATTSGVDAPPGLKELIESIIIRILGSFHTPHTGGKRDAQWHKANDKSPADIGLPENAIGGNREFPLCRSPVKHTARGAPCLYPGCQVTLPPKELKKHARAIHGVAASRFKCSEPGCGRLVESLVALARHAMVHSSDRLFACEWEGCEHSFRSDRHLKRHVDTIHLGLRWTCPSCKKELSPESKLHHQRFVCPVAPDAVEGKLVDCGIGNCEYKSNRNAVHTHRMRHDMCRGCGEIFPVMGELARTIVKTKSAHVESCPLAPAVAHAHYRLGIKPVVDGVKFYDCMMRDDCDYSTRRKSELKKHKSIHPPCKNGCGFVSPVGLSAMKTKVLLAVHLKACQSKAFCLQSYYETVQSLSHVMCGKGECEYFRHQEGGKKNHPKPTGQNAKTHRMDHQACPRCGLIYPSFWEVRDGPNKTRRAGHPNQDAKIKEFRREHQSLCKGRPANLTALEEMKYIDFVNAKTEDIATIAARHVTSSLSEENELDVNVGISTETAPERRSSVADNMLTRTVTEYPKVLFSKYDAYGTDAGCATFNESRMSEQELSDARLALELQNEEHDKLNSTTYKESPMTRQEMDDAKLARELQNEEDHHFAKITSSDAILDRASTNKTRFTAPVKGKGPSVQYGYSTSEVMISDNEDEDEDVVRHSPSRKQQQLQPRRTQPLVDSDDEDEEQVVHQSSVRANRKSLPPITKHSVTKPEGLLAGADTTTAAAPQRKRKSAVLKPESSTSDKDMASEDDSDEVRLAKRAKGPPTSIKKPVKRASRKKYPKEPVLTAEEAWQAMAESEKKFQEARKISVDKEGASTTFLERAEVVDLADHNSTKLRSNMKNYTIGSFFRPAR